MKHGGKMLACMMGGLTACSLAHGVTAETPENPYQSIIDRNVFSLKPPPPPVDPAEANKPEAVKITLTGITTILGNKRVLMKTAPPPGKPGQAPKTEQSYILTEGQREGDIEVLEIDDKAGSVKVNNGGTIQTLTFEKDGAKLPSTPAPAAAGVPGQHIIPGLPVAHPLPNPTGATTPTFQLPTRIPRLPTPGAQASVGNAGMVPSPVAAETGIPTYGTPGYLPGNTTTPVLENGVANPSHTQTILPGSQLSAEEQAIMIEAQRQAGGPTAALLPPTPLSPKANLAPTSPSSGGLGQLPQSPSPFLPPVPGQPQVGRY